MEPSHEPEDDMLPEYDFRKLENVVRGKYAGHTNGVIRVVRVRLDADIAPVFPDAASVNAALRQYLKDHPLQSTNPA